MLLWAEVHCGDIGNEIRYPGVKIPILPAPSFAEAAHERQGYPVQSPGSSLEPQGFATQCSDHDGVIGNDQDTASGFIPVIGVAPVDHAGDGDRRSQVIGAATAVEYLVNGAATFVA